MIRTHLKAAAIGTVSCLLAVLVALIITDVAVAQREVTAEYRDQAETLRSALLVTTDTDALARIMARTPAGADGMIAVHLSGGHSVGTSHAALSDVMIASRTRQERIVPYHDSDLVLMPVLLSDTATAVVEVRIPRPVFSSAFSRNFWMIVLGGILGTVIALVVVRAHSKPISRALHELADAAGTLTPKSGQLPSLPQAPPVELTRLHTGLTRIQRHWARLRTDERKLVADLSHRLRTPLTALRLDAESLGSSREAEQVRQSIAALEAKVNEVINSSDIRRPKPNTCAVGDVIETRMKFWTTLADNQRRPCGMEIQDRSTKVQLSRNSVESILDGLIVNVFHHTPAKAPFEVVVVRHVNWLTVVVDDGGTGIGDPHAALLRGNSGGGSTGLGLDIVRKCVERIGGSIHIEQAMLGGARIRLRLPAAEAAHPERHRPPKAWRLWRGVAVRHDEGGAAPGQQKARSLRNATRQ